MSEKVQNVSYYTEADANELVRRQPSLRVLYTSGYTEDVIVHHGRLDAGLHLLTKPYRRADLARMIRLVLGEKVVTKVAEEKA